MSSAETKFDAAKIRKHFDLDANNHRKYKYSEVAGDEYAMIMLAEIERLRAENETLAAFAAATSDEKMLLLRELKDA